MNELPVGLFDSGVGGLTVLRAMRACMPGESFLYLGDTARLPYGTKSRDTIARYSLQVTARLVERKIKLLVVACNTATAAALPALRRAYPEIPVIGVVEPGAKAACAASREGFIAVIGTESTIRGRAYDEAILKLRPDARVIGLPCPLFVPLAEDGLVEGPLAEGIAARYLDIAEELGLHVERIFPTVWCWVARTFLSWRTPSRMWPGRASRWWIPRPPRHGR